MPTATFTTEISLTTIFQQRFRAASEPNNTWEATVEGSGTVQDGSTSFARVDYLNNYDGPGAYTEDRIYLSFDIGTEIPSNATITNVKLLLYTDNTAQSVTDSDYMISRIVKATGIFTTPNGTTTGNAHDVSVRSDVVSISTTNDAVNEFDFGGSGDLFDYCVAQHAAGAKCAFFHMSKLTFDELVAGDGSAADPTGGNMNQFDGDTGTNPPILKVSYSITTYPTEFNRGSVSLDKGTIEIK